MREAIRSSAYILGTSTVSDAGSQAGRECIDTSLEYASPGDSERIWVEEGTLHAVQTVSSGSSNGSKSADQSFQEQHEASSTELSIKKGQKRSSPTGDVKGTNSASNKRSKHDIEIASDTEEELGD